MGKPILVFMLIWLNINHFSIDTFKTESQLIILKNNESSASYKINSNDLKIKALKVPVQNRSIASNKVRNMNFTYFN
jgi:hypothetical protein